MLRPNVAVSDSFERRAVYLHFNKAPAVIVLLTPIIYITECFTTIKSFSDERKCLEYNVE